MSAARRKGTMAETAIVNALIAAGYIHAERRALAGANDKGDVAGIPGLMIEAKNCSRDELPKWLREAVIERENAKADIGVVWHKIKGKGDPRDWAVTMTGAQFLEILDRLGYRPLTPLSPPEAAQNPEGALTGTDGLVDAQGTLW